MQNSRDFSGLTMPVFTAFGWAGEEAALKFALSQLETFIQMLYARLPGPARDQFAYYGLSNESQNVYLAAAESYERDAFIAFNARPMSFEVQLGLVDKTTLSKGLAAINKDPVVAHHLITQLDPTWTLRVQQMQIDEETGERAHHLDLFKDSVNEFTEDGAQEVFSRAAYLNEEDKWVTPIYLSLRLPSERASAMGITLLSVCTDLVMALLPISALLTGHKPKKPRATKSSAKAKSTKLATAENVFDPTAPREPDVIGPSQQLAESFSYVAELKPLHIRRGFVNLTPGHWPFFASSARAETRGVTVVFGGRQDRNCSVWRLQPDDQARLVLGPQVHDWLEENFGASESIRVTARKIDANEIRVTLESAGPDAAADEDIS